MDVPDSNSPPVPVPMSVENTFTPGALTSGFNAPSPERGPPDEKDAAVLKVTSGTFADARVAVAGEETASSVAVSLSCSSVNGMVTPGIAGLKKPGALLTTPIATAPFAAARIAFELNVQLPRETITRAPGVPPAG